MAWVSVEERLPDNGELVLGWMRHDKRFEWSKVLVLEYSDKRHGWWVEAGGYPVSKIYTVTHWMPLPEPPAAEAREEECQICPFHYTLEGFSPRHGCDVDVSDCQLHGDVDQCFGKPDKCPLRI